MENQRESEETMERERAVETPLNTEGDTAAMEQTLSLGGVIAAEAETAGKETPRQVLTPGDVHVAKRMPTPIDGTLRQLRCVFRRLSMNAAASWCSENESSPLCFPRIWPSSATSMRMPSWQCIRLRRSRSSHRRC